MIELHTRMSDSTCDASCGGAGITREIKTNRGLVRKRKKFEGNARVHNRMKYQQKAKKLKVGPE